MGGAVGRGGDLCGPPIARRPQPSGRSGDRFRGMRLRTFPTAASRMRGSVAVGRGPPAPPCIFRWKPVSIPMRPTRRLRNCLARTKTSTCGIPACGLIGFEPGDRRRVADLLEAPPERKAAWDLAKPGISFSRRLTAIEPDRTPSAESVLSEGQGRYRLAIIGDWRTSAKPRRTARRAAGPHGCCRQAAVDRIAATIRARTRGAGRPRAVARVARQAKPAASRPAAEWTAGATSWGSDLGGTRDGRLAGRR